MLTGPTPPASEPRRPTSWADVVGCLGALAMLFGTACFIAWLILG